MKNRYVSALLVLVFVYLSTKALEAASNAASFHQHVRWDAIFIYEGILLLIATLLLVLSLISKIK
jgi:hypothetical protein